MPFWDSQIPVQLGRTLFMLADYTGIRVPVVLLLNMVDVAAAQGKRINVAGIEKTLGIPVVPMVTADKKQYDAFFSLLKNCDKRASILNCDRLERIYRGTRWFRKMCSPLSLRRSVKGLPG
ncbi:MAG: FeoB small GTPase domain-containing protein [Lachnospiraceae bacterium]|nr:FeoB small GTPase domain-containing protein [Lachnospiraceae bacterium]